MPQEQRFTTREMLLGLASLGCDSSATCDSSVASDSSATSAAGTTRSLVALFSRRLVLAGSGKPNHLPPVGEMLAQGRPRPAPVHNATVRYVTRRRLETDRAITSPAEVVPTLDRHSGELAVCVQKCLVPQHMEACDDSTIIVQLSA